MPAARAAPRSGAYHTTNSLETRRGGDVFAARTLPRHVPSLHASPMPAHARRLCGLRCSDDATGGHAP